MTAFMRLLVLPVRWLRHVSPNVSMINTHTHIYIYIYMFVYIYIYKGCKTYQSVFRENLHPNEVFSMFSPVSGVTDSNSHLAPAS